MAESQDAVSRQIRDLGREDVADRVAGAGDGGARRRIAVVASVRAIPSSVIRIVG